MEPKKPYPMMELLMETFRKYLKSLEELPVDEYTKKIFFGEIYEHYK